MAVKIKSLEKVATEISPNYLYKDLTLDISQSKIVQAGYLNSIPGADIQSSLDVKAIINSLTNLFNTLPGQRFLFPEYGLDLYQFLFEPITQITGEMIGDKMLQSIKKFEPRVKVKKIFIDGRPEQNSYFITLVVEIPSLQATIQPNYSFDLKKQSIIFIPTTRNT